MKSQWQYFRFWLASKIIMIAVGIIDKDTFEGISLALALDGWTKELVNRIHYEKMVNDNKDYFDEQAQKHRKEKTDII